MHWLVRAKRWAQNPPSAGHVKLVLGVIALCLMIVGLEWAFGWPEWLTPNRLNAKP
jgi:phosphotransferase system  glucose/maltose/N-acetylglucosamine-specific IIC component